jgi:hypothetical protein
MLSNFGIGFSTSHPQFKMSSLSKGLKGKSWIKTYPLFLNLAVVARMTQNKIREASKR